MTNDEAKNALFKRVPVTHNGIKYAKITAIIYRVNKQNQVVVSAELLDYSNHSVTIAQVKDVTFTDDNKNQTASLVP